MAMEGQKEHRVFPSSPDPRLYYPSTTHEKALGRLLHSLEQGEPFALLAGETGMGKTLLAQVLLERLENRSGVLFLAHGRFESSEGLLKSLLFDLGVTAQSHSISDLRLQLTGYLLDLAKDSGPGLIIQDEAHLLGREIFEEYRILGNLEAGTGRAIQTVFLGNPETLDCIQDPVLVSLRQRLFICPLLEKLGDCEAADYLLYHGRRRFGPGGYFSEEALECLVKFSKGVPRLLNQSGQLAHEYRLALDPAHTQVSKDAAKRAVEDLISPWGHQGVFPGAARDWNTQNHFSEPEVKIISRNELGLSA